ncbi:hypothetical protein [Rhodococcus erythropolis]|nr:hypothetical protein [Rhodococcus erythropolis]
MAIVCGDHGLSGAGMSNENSDLWCTFEGGGPEEVSQLVKYL